MLNGQKPIIIFTIFFLSILTTSFGQSIKGKVIDGTRDEIMSGAYVGLFDSAFSKPISIITADDDGNFVFSNIPIGTYNIKVNVIVYRDTIFRNIKITGDTDLVLDIHKFCQYDAARKDRTCPTCHKKDKVIPIEYGLRISNKGEGKTFKSGGCNITLCDPNWYCKRDKLEF
jgi:hypothetical protein